MVGPPGVLNCFYWDFAKEENDNKDNNNKDNDNKYNDIEDNNNEDNNNEENDNNEKNKEFKFVISGQFCTLAMFLIHSLLAHFVSSDVKDS